MISKPDQLPLPCTNNACSTSSKLSHFSSSAACGWNDENVNKSLKRRFSETSILLHHDDSCSKREKQLTVQKSVSSFLPTPTARPTKCFLGSMPPRLSNLSLSSTKKIMSDEGAKWLSDKKNCWKRLRTFKDASMMVDADGAAMGGLKRIPQVEVREEASSPNRIFLSSVVDTGLRGIESYEEDLIFDDPDISTSDALRESKDCGLLLDNAASTQPSMFLPPSLFSSPPATLTPSPESKSLCSSFYSDAKKIQHRESGNASLPEPAYINYLSWTSTASSHLPHVPLNTAPDAGAMESSAQEEDPLTRLFESMERNYTPEAAAAASEFAGGYPIHSFFLKPSPKGSITRERANEMAMDFCSQSKKVAAAKTLIQETLMGCKAERFNGKLRCAYILLLVVLRNTSQPSSPLCNLILALLTHSLTRSITLATGIGATSVDNWFL